MEEDSFPKRKHQEMQNKVIENLRSRDFVLVGEVSGCVFGDYSCWKVDRGKRSGSNVLREGVQVLSKALHQIRYTSSLSTFLV